MYVHELNTIEIVLTKHDVEMKTSTRTIIATCITVIDKWIWVNRDESGVGECRWWNC